MARTASKGTPARVKRESAQRIPKLRGRAPIVSLDSSVFASWRDDLWLVVVYSDRVHAGRGRVTRWHWHLEFQGVEGLLRSSERFYDPLKAVADARRVLRRILGAST